MWRQGHNGSWTFYCLCAPVLPVRVSNRSLQCANVFNSFKLILNTLMCSQLPIRVPTVFTSLDVLPSQFIDFV